MKIERYDVWKYGPGKSAGGTARTRARLAFALLLIIALLLLPAAATGATAPAAAAEAAAAPASGAAERGAEPAREAGEESEPFIADDIRSDEIMYASAGSIAAPPGSIQDRPGPYNH